MAEMCVKVPAALVDAIRETVLLLYQATAESLHFALRARSEHGGSLDEVAQHRARLARLEALLGQLGWRPGPAPEAAELSASRELLHDALYGALIDAGERLAQASNRCWRGELPLEQVRSAAEEVLAIDKLLQQLDERA